MRRNPAITKARRARPNAPDVTPSDVQETLAPWPLIDRSPIIIGSNLSLQYLAGAFRTALNGYRTNFVDLLSELLENDPHMFGVLSQRVLSVSCGRLEVTAAKTREESNDAKFAAELAAFVDAQIDGIKERSKSFNSLCWSLYFGPSASELHWTFANNRWHVDRLGFIHSRRLGYPDSLSWDLHIWDQGIVGMPGDGAPTGQIFGISVNDYPGKFVTSVPQLRAEYPTRDGLGRVLAVFSLLKRLVVRVSAQDFERFVKPWVLAYFNTAVGPDGKPRAASEGDKRQAKAAVDALGVGSLAAAVLPDSVKVELVKAASELNQIEFLAYLEASQTKAVLGQTFTTEPGKFGSKGTNEQGANQELKLFRYDAACFCDDLDRDLVIPIIKLNYPGNAKAIELRPKLRIHVEERPDPAKVMQVAVQGATVGMPIDADDLASNVGLKLIPKVGNEPRALIAPGTQAAQAADGKGPDDGEKGSGKPKKDVAASDEKPTSKENE